MHHGTWLMRALVVAAICVAGFLLYRALSRYSFEEVVASIRSIPPMRLLAAFGFAGCSYLCLTFFDGLGIRYAGKSLPYRKTALASFVSLSIGHNIGVAALSSGAIRYRFYSNWGLDAEDVAKVILFSGMTVALGLITLGGLGMLLNPAAAAQMTGFSVQSVRGLGLGCLAIAIGYLLLSAFLRSSLVLGKWRFEMPSPRLASAQVLIGSVNFAFVAACLHQTLAVFTDADYLAVSSVYVIANTTAIVSHVPGGLGVLETAILYLISGGSLVGALIAFRFVYFFVPLGLGVTLLVLSERQFLRQAERHKRDRAAHRAPPETRSTQYLSRRASRCSGQ